MITAGELRYVRDIINDLAAIADPSEFLEEEVDEAIRILDSLLDYDSGLICDVVTEINNIEYIEQGTIQDE